MILCPFKERKIEIDECHDGCPFYHQHFCGYGMDAREVKKMEKLLKNLNKEINRVI